METDHDFEAYAPRDEQTPTNGQLPGNADMTAQNPPQPKATTAPRLTWSEEMKAGVHLIHTEIKDSPPYDLHARIFNTMFRDQLTAQDFPDGIAYYRIKKQLVQKDNTLSSIKAWEGAVAVVKSDRGAELLAMAKQIAGLDQPREVMRGAADHGTDGVVSYGTAETAADADGVLYNTGHMSSDATPAKTRRVKWTAEMRATAYLISRHIEEDPPHARRATIFNTMYGEHLTKCGFPVGIKYAKIHDQLLSKCDKWVDAISLMGSGRGAELLKNVMEIADPEKSKQLDEMLDGNKWKELLAEDMKICAENNHPKFAKPILRWTVEMRATAYLISIHVKDTHPYNLRTAVFNEMYGEHLVDCGFSAGVEYPLVYDQLTMRNRKREVKGKQWPAAMAVADSERGEELLQKVRQLAGITTPGEMEREIVRAGPDNAPHGDVLVGATTSVANPADTVYPDEEDTLEATAALRPASDLPSDTTPSYANFEDVLGMDNDKMAESVDTWLASVGAGGRR
ncbi:hypothetical protein LTS10_008788 [Elasticomyces elasticus]|nr:hypothetical protein LTS10_008788 [Elasticomyces elasticus]